MGMNPPRYLSEGDTVETTIEGIGTIRSTCVSAKLN